MASLCAGLRAVYHTCQPEQRCPWELGAFGVHPSVLFDRAGPLARCVHLSRRQGQQSLTGCAIDWAGIDQPNEFTHNALVNLQGLTGQPPKIRVGANSEDHTLWSPTVTIVEASFPPASSIVPYPEATSIIVGDGYYQLSKWLPSGTHMIWGVNLGLDNVTNAVNMAKSIIKAFATQQVRAANIHLDLIEIGQ